MTAAERDRMIATLADALTYRAATDAQRQGEALYDLNAALAELSLPLLRRLDHALSLVQARISETLRVRDE